MRLLTKLFLFTTLSIGTSTVAHAQAQVQTVVLEVPYQVTNLHSSIERVKIACGLELEHEGETYLLGNGNNSERLNVTNGDAQGLARVEIDVRGDLLTLDRQNNVSYWCRMSKSGGPGRQAKRLSPNEEDARYRTVSEALIRGTLGE